MFSTNPGLNSDTPGLKLHACKYFSTVEFLIEVIAECCVK
jgi:hypothetical protein